MISTSIPKNSEARSGRANAVLVLEPPHHTGWPLVLLGPGKHLIGTDPNCSVRVEADGVHAQHAMILIGDHTILLKALDPKTWVNDGVATEARLRAGDRISIGPITYRARMATPEELTTLTPVTPMPTAAVTVDAPAATPAVKKQDKPQRPVAIEIPAPTVVLSEVAIEQDAPHIAPATSAPSTCIEPASLTERAAVESVPATETTPASHTERIEENKPGADAVAPTPSIRFTAIKEAAPAPKSRLRDLHRQIAELSEQTSSFDTTPIPTRNWETSEQLETREAELNQLALELSRQSQRLRDRANRLAERDAELERKQTHQSAENERLVAIAQGTRQEIADEHARQMALWQEWDSAYRRSAEELKAQLEAVDQRRASLQAEQERIAEERAEVQKLQVEFEQERQALSADRMQATAELSEFHKARAAFETDRRQHFVEIQERDAQLTSERRALSAAQDELLAMRQQFEHDRTLFAAERTSESLRRETEVREQTLARVRLNDEASELQSARLELESNQRLFDQERAKLTNEIEAFEAAKSEFEGLRAELVQLQSELELSQQAHRDLQSHWETAQAKITNHRSEIEESRSEIAQLQSKLEISQQEHRDLQSRFEAAQTEVEQQRSEIEESRKDLEQQQAQLDEVREAIIQELEAFEVARVELEAAKSRHASLSQGAVLSPDSHELPESASAVGRLMGIPTNESPPFNASEFTSESFAGQSHFAPDTQSDLNVSGRRYDLAEDPSRWYPSGGMAQSGGSAGDDVLNSSSPEFWQRSDDNSEQREGTLKSDEPGETFVTPEPIEQNELQNDPPMAVTAIDESANDESSSIENTLSKVNEEFGYVSRLLDECLVPQTPELQNEEVRSNPESTNVSFESVRHSHDDEDADSANRESSDSSSLPSLRAQLAQMFDLPEISSNSDYESGNNNPELASSDCENDHEENLPIPYQSSEGLLSSEPIAEIAPIAACSPESEAPLADNSTANVVDPIREEPTQVQPEDEETAWSRRLRELTQIVEPNDAPLPPPLPPSAASKQDEPQAVESTNEPVEDDEYSVEAQLARLLGRPVQGNIHRMSETHSDKPAASKTVASTANEVSQDLDSSTESLIVDRSHLAAEPKHKQDRSAELEKVQSFRAVAQMSARTHLAKHSHNTTKRDFYVAGFLTAVSALATTLFVGLFVYGTDRDPWKGVACAAATVLSSHRLIGTFAKLNQTRRKNAAASDTKDKPKAPPSKEQPHS